MKTPDPLFGIALIGQANQNIEIMTQIAIGAHRHHMLAAGYYKGHDGIIMNDIETLKGDAASINFADNTERFYQSIIQDLVRSEHNSMQKEKQQNLENKIKEFNAPAPEGTVSELAEKYNVSKKQIRTLKRENRLHELTNEK